MLREADSMITLTPTEVKALLIDVQHYQRGPQRSVIDDVSEAIAAGMPIEPIHINVRESGKRAVIEGGQRTRAAQETDAPLRAVVYKGLTVNEEGQLFEIYDKKRKIQGPFLIAAAADRGHPIARAMVDLVRDEKSPAFGKIRIEKEEDGSIIPVLRGLDSVLLLTAYHAYRYGTFYSNTKLLLEQFENENPARFIRFVTRLAEIFYNPKKGMQVYKNTQGQPMSPQRGLVIGIGSIMHKHGASALDDKRVLSDFRRVDWNAIAAASKKGTTPKDRLFARHVLVWYEEKVEA